MIHERARWQVNTSSLVHGVAVCPGDQVVPGGRAGHAGLPGLRSQPLNAMRLKTIRLRYSILNQYTLSHN